MSNTFLGFGDVLDVQHHLLRFIKYQVYLTSCLIKASTTNSEILKFYYNYEIEFKMLYVFIKLKHFTIMRLKYVKIINKG